MSDPLALLRITNFRAFMFARFLVTFALQMQFIAVQWQVYSLTKDPLSLGLIGLAEVVPAVCFALFAGHIVDQRRRKTVLLSAMSLSAFVSILFFALSSFRMQLESAQVVGISYFGVFLLGVSRSFMAPASFAFFGEFMPREHYIRASAWSSTAWQTAAALGPAAGGLIYGLSGPTLVFALAMIHLLAGVYFMSTIPGRPAQSSTREPLMQSLSIGLRFVFRNQIVLSALSLDLFAVLFGGAIALLPMFADLLEVGPQGLGLLRAAPSVGAFFVALYLTQRPPTRNTGKVLLTCVACFGICIIGFGLSRSFLVSLILLALSGCFDAVSVIVRSGILQLSTPTEMRGRVSAVNSIFISSSNELGAFESGVTAKWMGAVPAVIFGGCMTLFVVGVTAAVAPKMRSLQLKDLKTIES